MSGTRVVHESSHNSSGVISEGHACIEGATCIECSGAESTAVRSE